MEVRCTVEIRFTTSKSTPGPSGCCTFLYVSIKILPITASAADGGAGLTLLLGALGEDDRDNVAGRNEQSDTACGAARQGNYAPFAKVMGLEVPEATALLNGKLAALAPRLGPWTGARLIGTAARGGRWYTYVRFDFQRGSRIAELGWAGPTAETLRFLDVLPGQNFLPETATTFAAFEIRTGAILRATCNLPAAGPATSLTLRAQGAAGEVQAVRAH